MKNGFILFLVVTLTISPGNSLGAPVVLSERAHQIDYEIYLKSSPNDETYTHWFLAQAVPKNITDHMYSAFLTGKRNLFLGQIRQAQSHFLKIYDIRLKYDWSIAERQLVYESILNLAEIDPDRGEEFLRAAHRFDPSQTPSPPLSKKNREKFQEISKSENEWEKAGPFPSEILDPDITVLVNGNPRNFNSREDLRLPRGEHRFTFLSNRFIPVSLIGSIADLSSFRYKAIPYSTGTCERPIWTSPPRPKGIKVLFDENCVRTTDEDEWENTSRPSISDLKPQNNNTQGLNGNSIADFSKLKGSNEKGSGLFSKPLFWGILGAAIIGIILASSKNTSSPNGDTAPTPTNYEERR